MAELKLNLGSSDDRKPGFVSVDRVPPADVIADLNEPWPWFPNRVDYIYCKDCAEHIANSEFPEKEGMIWFMNEAWRVLKPGGIMELIVPCLPGQTPFLDPTHKSVWCKGTRYYFDERWNNPQGERGRLGPGMGITALFRTLPSSRSGVDWNPIAYAPDDPDRHKLFLLLETVK